jgi:hypothetical protein
MQLKTPTQRIRFHCILIDKRCFSSWLPDYSNGRRSRPALAAADQRKVGPGYKLNERYSLNCESRIFRVLIWTKDTIRRSRELKHIHIMKRFRTALVCFLSFDNTYCALSSSLLDRSGGLLYRTGIVPSKEEWQSILNEVTSLSLKPESPSSIAHNRLAVTLSPTTSPLIKRLRDPTFAITKYVQRMIATPSSEPYILAPHIPVEVRSYERIGACMAWHTDDVLYHPKPQVELVLTLLNTSNCRTQWRITETSPMEQVETQPNSLLLLRAGVTPHSVTSLRYGKRLILKCAYCAPDAVYFREEGFQNDRPNDIGRRLATT